MENTNFTPKSSLQTTDSKQNEERNPAKAHAFTSSFTPNLHHRHTGRRSRMISRKKEFSPKPPPHHTPEQNNFEEEEFAGAWKQIVAAVSHDPKVSDCDELEKEDANKVSPAKNTYTRKRKKPIDVVSAIPINKSTAMNEQIEKKKKKKKKEIEEEPIHEAAKQVEEEIHEAAKQVEEEIHEAAKQVVEVIHEAAMGIKTDKVCKEWEREQNMQIVVFEKIYSDEPKKTTEANEVVFKSIETEMGNSRKMSRAKKRNLPRMIAAKKSSTPQIPSNSEGRNNSEELDELESSSEPCTEREEENCEEEDEYTSTATPATGLVSEIPILQLCENVDKMIKKWDNIIERSASASTSAISSDQLMRSFRSLQEILSLPFTQVINNSSTRGRFVSLCNLLLPCMFKKDSSKWIPLQLFSKGFDTTASKFSTAKATLEQVRQLLEDHKVKFPNSDEFNCKLNAAKLKQAEDSQVEKLTAQKIRDLKNQLDSATKKVVDAHECVEELLKAPI